MIECGSSDTEWCRWMWSCSRLRSPGGRAQVCTLPLRRSVALSPMFLDDLVVTILHHHLCHLPSGICPVSISPRHVAPLDLLLHLDPTTAKEALQRPLLSRKLVVKLGSKPRRLRCGPGRVLWVYWGGTNWSIGRVERISEIKLLTRIGRVVNFVVQVDVHGTVVRAEHFIVDVAGFDPWPESGSAEDVVYTGTVV